MCRSFYKHLLGVPVDFADIEVVDSELHRSLQQILECPVEVLGVDMTFSTDAVTFGAHKVI